MVWTSFLYFGDQNWMHCSKSGPTSIRNVQSGLKVKSVQGLKSTFQFLPEWDFLQKRVCHAAFLPPSGWCQPDHQSRRLSHPASCFQKKTQSAPAADLDHIVLPVTQLTIGLMDAVTHSTPTLWQLHTAHHPPVDPYCIIWAYVPMHWPPNFFCTTLWAFASQLPG